MDGDQHRLLGLIIRDCPAELDPSKWSQDEFERIIDAVFESIQREGITGGEINEFGLKLEDLADALTREYDGK